MSDSAGVYVSNLPTLDLTSPDNLLLTTYLDRTHNPPEFVQANTPVSVLSDEILGHVVATLAALPTSGPGPYMLTMVEGAVSWQTIGIAPTGNAITINGNRIVLGNGGTLTTG